MPRQGIDQVRCHHRLGNAILPSPAFDQIFKEQRQNVIRRDEGPIRVNDAEAVSVAVGGNADVRVVRFHCLAKIAEQMVVGFGSMSAEEHITAIMDCHNIDAGFL